VPTRSRVRDHHIDAIGIMYGIRICHDGSKDECEMPLLVDGTIHDPIAIGCDGIEGECWMPGVHDVYGLVNGVANGVYGVANGDANTLEGVCWMPGTHDGCANGVTNGVGYAYGVA
jgi:hypothetical protein